LLSLPVLLSLLPLAALAAAFEPPGLFNAVEELRLDNGMLFILLPRHDVPSISGRIIVKAGNVDNQVGQTGLAHMFEHMAFKGTDRIGSLDPAAERARQDSVSAAGAALAAATARRQESDSTRTAALRAELERLMDRQLEYSNPSEFFQLLERYSTDYNATTSTDYTNYITKVPANHLEAWMLLESERFQHPSFREFYRELDIVKEERLQRVTDDPEGLAWELLQSLAFTAHPYRFPTIGFMSDLEVLTQDEAERFWRSYYVPGNAIAVLVGEFDPDRARDLIEAYFGDIPAAPPPPVVATVEPPQLGIRRAVLRKGKDRQLVVAFPGYPPRSRQAAVASLLSSVLSDDDTSRLIRRLDVQEHAAKDVSSSSRSGFRRYPGLFAIEATPLDGISNETVENLIWEELERVVSEPVSESKLDEIRSARRKSYYFRLETNDALAAELAYTQADEGDWRRSYLVFDEYESISPDEISALARELFVRDKACIVTLEPEEEEEGSGS